ncbi:LytR/AlgR family response regulator transcription factor [Dysgonomonas termitidis]|uniref:LytR/AlgR family response regulator transcription factor n=1 Tax=Dysgonomonas termitidis TaxID=1516126 RepID=A0ABV9KWF9_9BACT
MENRKLIYIHILIASSAGITLYICIKPLVDISEYVLITDSAISGTVLSGLLLLLRNIAQYSRISSFPVRQQLINYSALAILFVACWLCIEFLALYLVFPEEGWAVLLHTIPIRIVLALLVYSLTIATFTRMYIAEDKIADIAIENEKEVRERPGNIPEPVTEAENNETLERIAVKNGQKIDVVLVSEIIHLQAEGDYVMIHSTKGKFLKEQTMKSFESGLPQDKFVRVHRSSIVNIEFISQIELYDKQSQLLKLKNGGHVRISLSGYKALKKTLGL